jgi:hypothetical protein
MRTFSADRSSITRTAPPRTLAELLDDPTLLARYRAAMGGQAVGRMVPSLPYLEDVPAGGGLRVRLTTARAVLDVGDDARPLLRPRLPRNNTPSRRKWEATA